MADIPGQIEPLVDEGRLTNPIWYEWLMYLRGAVKSLATFQTSAEAAWTTTFTPVVGSSGGGVPFASATCRYHRVGHTVSIHYEVNIGNVGPATGFPTVTLPVTPARQAVFVGRENAVVGKAVVGHIISGVVWILMVDGAASLVNSYNFVLDGVYEV